MLEVYVHMHVIQTTAAVVALLFAGQFEHAYACACVRGKVAARRGAARPAQIHKINHMYCTCQPA